MSDQIKFESVDYNPFREAEILKVSGLVDAQKEIWLACKIGGKEANLSYNESISLILEGILNEEHLSQACKILSERHEALKMVFAPNGIKYMVTDQANVPFLFLDWTEADRIERDFRLAHFLEKEVDTEFDLQNGPLARFTLIKLEDNIHHFTITAHHLVCDGWSFGILFEELASIYYSLFEGIPFN